MLLLFCDAIGHKELLSPPKCRDLTSILPGAP